MGNSVSTQEAHPYYLVLWDNKKEILLLIILGTVLAYTYYSWQDKKPVVDVPVETSKVLTLRQVEVNDFQNEKKRWKIIGSKALVTEDTKNVLLNDIKILIYTPESNSIIDLQITAKSSLIDWGLQQVVLTENVKVEKGSSMHLNAEKAIYNYKSGNLTLPGSVDYHHGEDTVLGQNLRYNVHEKVLNLQKVTFLK